MKETIRAFYDKLIEENKVSKELLEKIKKVKNEEDLKELFNEEIIPLAKQNGYEFTEEELLNYEKNQLKKISEEDLENIAGGAVLRSFLMAGGISALAMIGLGSISSGVTNATVSKNIIENSVGILEEDKTSDGNPLQQTEETSKKEETKKETLIKTPQKVEVKEKKVEKTSDSAKEKETSISLKESQKKVEAKEKKVEKTFDSTKEKGTPISLTESQKKSETKEVKVDKIQQVGKKSEKIAQKDKKDISEDKKEQEETKKSGLGKEQVKDSVHQATEESSESKEEKQTQAQTDMKYIINNLNMVDPYIMKTTGVLQNLRFYVGRTDITLARNDENGRYRLKANNDKGAGLADLMKILFPSSAGDLSVDGGDPNESRFSEDCKPTPEDVAKITAFIYNYRNMTDQNKKKTLKQNIKNKINMFDCMFDYKKHKSSIVGSTNNKDLKNLVDLKLVATDQNGKPLSATMKIFKNNKEDEVLKKFFEYWNEKSENIKAKTRYFDKYKSIKSNENEISKERIKAFFKDNLFKEDNKNIDLKKAETILRVLDNAICMIDNQEYTGEDYNAGEANRIVPKGMPEKILMSYFIEKFNTEDDVTRFYGKVKELIKVDNTNSNSEDLSDAKESLNKKVNLLKQVEKSDLTPYSGKTLQNGATYQISKIEEGKVTFKNGTFADCADIAARHVVNLLGYSANKNWDNLIGSQTSDLESKLEKVKNAINGQNSIKFMPLEKRLQMFFYHQSKVGVNAGDIVTRTLWEYAISNMNEKVEDGMYEIKYVHGNYELETGHINSLKLLYNIAKAYKFGSEKVDGKTKLEIAKESIDKLDGTDATDDSIKDAVEKVYKLFNENIEITNVPKKASGASDLYGKITVEVVDKKYRSNQIRFSINQESGHGWVEHDPVKLSKDYKSEDYKDEKGNYEILLRNYIEKLKNRKVSLKYDGLNSLYKEMSDVRDDKGEIPQWKKNYRAMKFLKTMQGEENNVYRIYGEFTSNPGISESDINVNLIIKSESKTIEEGGKKLSSYISENYGIEEDGVLFNKDKTKLIYCDRNKTGDYVIPSSVTTIRERTFEFCRRLTKITIPSSVTTIGDNAFLFCDSLTSITFEKGSKLETIGENAFSSCYNLKAITIPSSVTTIGKEAFFYCKSLTNITFEEGSQLTTIGKYAFAGCENLESITIPSSVTTIGERAFEGCKKLTNITFEKGSQLETIGEEIFRACYDLEEITIIGDAENPTENLEISEPLRDLGKTVKIGTGIKSIKLHGTEKIDVSDSKDLESIDSTNSERYLTDNDGNLYEKNEEGSKGMLIWAKSWWSYFKYWLGY